MDAEREAILRMRNTAENLDSKFPAYSNNGVAGGDSHRRLASRAESLVQEADCLEVRGDPASCRAARSKKSQASEILKTDKVYRQKHRLGS